MDKLIIMIVGGLMFVSCELGQELDIQDMGESSGYFIECYCEPGEMFNLTATRLAPIAEDQLLDYSLKFETYIIAGERFKLYHSLFMKPDSRFIYNYASNRRLSREDADTLYLDMLAPDGTFISGETGIPEDIRFDSVRITGEQIYTCFTTSSDVSCNYFILQIQAFEGKKPEGRKVYYMQDLSAGSKVESRQDFTLSEKTDSVVVTLKRFTKEGFQYQLSVKDAEDANKGSLVAPAPLVGNLEGAIGVFTCFTKDRICFKRSEF